MYHFNLVLHSSTTKSKGIFYALVALLMSFSFFQVSYLHAAERMSYSIDNSSNAKLPIKDELLLDKNFRLAPALITQGEQIPLTTSNQRIYIANPDNGNQISANSQGGIFSIYDASVGLIHDDDGDGFYHQFSVTFDADISFGSALVFARMYISYEGGPWNYYYTTKTFEIITDSNFDAHTVETIFTSGYAPGRYDIRIELFEAGWTGSVASYGPIDDLDLNYLPLEDEEHEFFESVAAAGCSLSPNARFDPVLPLLFLLSLLYFFRRFYQKNTVNKLSATS